MKKHSLAFVVLATTLAVAPPSALCDSFGYRTSGSKFGVNSTFDTVHRGAPNRIAESGLSTNTELANMGGSKNDGVLGSKTIERPITGSFFFDSLLQGNKGGRQDDSGAVIDLNGQQLVLLSNSQGVSKSGKGGQFFFADKGSYRISNGLQSSGGFIRNRATALAVTPEPGSLFLLGTGLLGMALVLFWKAAKRTTGT